MLFESNNEYDRFLNNPLFIEIVDGITKSIEEIDTSRCFLKEIEVNIAVWTSQVYATYKLEERENRPIYSLLFDEHGYNNLDKKALKEFSVSLNTALENSLKDRNKTYIKHSFEKHININRQGRLLPSVVSPFI